MLPIAGKHDLDEGHDCRHHPARAHPPGELQHPTLFRLSVLYGPEASGMMVKSLRIFCLMIFHQFNHGIQLPLHPSEGLILLTHDHTTIQATTYAVSSFIVCHLPWTRSISTCNRSRSILSRVIAASSVIAGTDASHCGWETSSPRWPGPLRGSSSHRVLVCITRGRV